MTTADEPRIPPLPPAEWPEGMKAALAALRPENPRHPFPPRDPSRPKGLNILGTLAQHPDLTTAYHTFNGHLLFGTSLSPRQRELLVLRVGVLRDAEYEWRQHVIMAGDAGISPEEIEWIIEGPSAAGWSPIDRAFVAAADELIADAKISDDTWAVLAGELDIEQLMDLVFTVGAYETLAMAMRSFGIQLDDDLR